MTPRERAKALQSEIGDYAGMPSDVPIDVLEDAIAAAESAARDEERKRCKGIAARFARDYRADGENEWADAAEMIRDEIGGGQ